MKLVLVIPSITAGGAERVMSILANYWADQNWAITLLTLDDGSAPPFFPLDSRIVQRPLHLFADSRHPFAAIANNLKRLIVLRRAIAREAPDAVISFLDTTNVLTLLASRGLGIPIVVSERVDLSSQPIKWAWDRLRRWAYGYAARIVILTERAREALPPSLQARCRVIPNPVLPPAEPREPATSKLTPQILAMGRLSAQKGFDVLLDAFASVRPGFPDWRLVIVGEGSLRQALETRSAEPDLAGSVSLPGQTGTPANAFRQSDLFVLSSRFEGFPNALCEAMAAGLPVIASDCPTGPREIIQDGKNGLLVPTDNVAALAEAMARLMADSRLRNTLGREARDITQRYGLTAIASLWEAVLDEALEQSRS